MSEKEILSGKILHKFTQPLMEGEKVKILRMLVKRPQQSNVRERGGFLKEVGNING